MKKLIIILLSLFPVIAINAQNDRATVLQNLEQSKISDQEQSMTATLKSASRLFGDKNDLTTVIQVIPSGSVVDVIDSDSTYFHVIFEDNEGYIYKRHAVIDAASATSEPLVQQQVPVQEQEQIQQPQQVSRFTYLENKYGSNMAGKLMSGKIWKGMSSEMIRDSWGKPQKINRVISGNTVKEEWI